MLTKDNYDSKIAEIHSIYKNGFQNLTDRKRIKMRSIITSQIQKIQSTLENDVKRNTVQKRLEQKNLKERSLLQNKINSKLNHAQRLRTENYEKIQSIQRQHINYVQKISQRMKEIDHNKLVSPNKILSSGTEAKNSKTLKTQVKIKNGYKSLSHFRNNYQQALLKKEIIFSKNVQFADISHIQMLNRLDKGYQNRVMNLQSKQNQFFRHQQLLSENYKKHQIIQREKTQNYINNIVENRERSETQKIKNYQRNNQKLKQIQTKYSQHKSRILFKRLSLDSHTFKKFNSSLNQQNPQNSNVKDISPNPNKKSKSKELLITKRTSLFLPLVTFNKQLIQQKQSIKQNRIINKHNEQYHFLKNKQIVSDKTLSLYKSSLFNKDPRILKKQSQFL